MAVIGGYPGQSISGTTLLGRLSYQQPQQFWPSGQSPSPVIVAGAATRLWLPSDLGSKLKTWLKGDDLVGSNGASVTSWADASGNTNDATGATNKPTLVTAGLNGMNTVAFDGAAQYFTLPTGLLSGRTQSASFAVYNLANSPPLSDPHDGPVFGDFGTESTTGNHNPYTDGNFYDDYCSTTRRTVTTVPASTAFRIFGLRSKAADWRLDINGTNYFTDSTNTFGGNTAPLIGSTQVPAGYYLQGQIAEIVDCNDFLTTAEKEQVEGYLAWKWALQGSLPVAHTYSAAPPVVAVSAGTTAYSLAADVGTFTYSGQAAGLLEGLDMVAANASFSYTGQAAVLSYGRPMAAALGTFSYSGQAAGLLQGLDLAVAGATYSYTGQNAVLSYGRPMAAAVGTFTYNGQPAMLTVGLEFAAAAGVFSYTGEPAGLSLGLSMPAAAGIFTYNGQNANLSLAIAYSMPATVGTFSYSGQAAALLRGFEGQSDVGIYSYTGEDALLAARFGMAAAAGIYSYAGQSARGTLSLDTFPPMSVVSGVRVTAGFFR